MDLGATPLTGVVVPCGESQVVINHPRYEKVAKVETAAQGSAPNIDVSLVRPKGVLTLRSIPPGASFTVDGEDVGHGTASARVLQFETLHVTATLAGYATWHTTLKLTHPTDQLFARMTKTK
jgi:hypothetical protein